jgi:hypothetical protein
MKDVRKLPKAIIHEAYVIKSILKMVDELIELSQGRFSVNQSLDIRFPSRGNETL